MQNHFEQKKKSKIFINLKISPLGQNDSAHPNYEADARKIAKHHGNDDARHIFKILQDAPSLAKLMREELHESGTQ